MKVRTASAILIVNVIGIVLAGTVQGRPSYATNRDNNCNACHTSEVTGRMEVTGEDSLTNLGIQLDGSVRGPLKTYKAAPGQVITLSVSVLDGKDVFAVQIKDFEKPARRNNSNNLLIWSPVNNADNTWNRQEVSNPPYFTRDNGNNAGLSGSISPITYTFDLLIELGTPVDVYELVFAAPGRTSGLGTVYQEEHFYIEVVSPFDFNRDGIVDGADITVMVNHWHTEEPLYDITPEPFGDGIVDVQDLILLSEHFFEDSRMVAHWKLDDSEGAIAHAGVGDKEGALNGELIWQPDDGKIDGALQFDGIDDYVSTDFTFNPVNGSFSVFAWIKGGAAGQVIVSQTDATAGRTTIPGSTWLGIDPSNGTLITTLMELPHGPLVSEFVITDVKWHHIGLVYDLDGLMRQLYVDGLEIASDTDVVGPVSSDGGLYFGAGKNLDEGSFFSGLIDDIRIYPSALNAEEIQALVR
ncbi:MAG: hypothetical protein GY845_22660 [Planctomycetes bacterium]|nr:hypothetical protein [Planctomycetota bacterium]